MFKLIYKFFTEKYYYFIVFKIKSEKLFNNNSNPIIDKQVVNWVKKFFLFKFSKIEYHEFLPLKENGTFTVWGNCPNDGKKINRNVFLFMVELVNELKTNGQFKVTKDFPYEEINKFGYKIKVYKIKKFK